jgi:site-specific DNA-methyltransferase (adenine-specific)
MVSSHTSERNGHPCPKPIEWMMWAVAIGSVEGETIIDPFAGSGTTGRAAKDMGRKAVLIEREERYCEIAARRMAQDVLPLCTANTSVTGVTTAGRNVP